MKMNNAGKVEGNNGTQFCLAWIILVMQTNCQGQNVKTLDSYKFTIKMSCQIDWQCQ